jgi:hypothetical protein
MERKIVPKQMKEGKVLETLSKVPEEGLIGRLSEREQVKLAEARFLDEQSKKSSFMIGQWIE